jgi:glucan phosphoethanolaminetransferase (alkaline phosphatase superfamily)
MTGLLRSILGIVRLILIALFVYVNWPTLTALVNHEMTWNQAVGALFSNLGIVALLLILVISFVISFLRNIWVKIAVNGLTILILIGLFTGVISIGSLSNTVNSYINADQIKAAISPCNWSTSVESIGGQLRTVLKDDKGTVIGYVQKDDGQDGNRAQLVDTANKALTCNP